MKSLPKLLALGLFVILALYLSAARQSTRIQEAEFAGHGFLHQKGKLKKITHWIAHDTLIQKFEESNSDSLLLEVYPIKLTPGPKQDFELLVNYHYGTNTAKQKKLETALKKKAGFYISYLKNEKVSEQSIPWGYQLKLDRQEIGNKNNLLLYLSFQDLSITYETDSCKYPPGCEEPEELLTVADVDSACKYPPGCLYTMLSTQTVGNVIRETYKKQTKKK